MRKQKGFSLIELLIVVAIILIIATIAIPSLLRSRQSAQESSAVAQIRTINTAEITYLSSNQGSYGAIPELITHGVDGYLVPPRDVDAASKYAIEILSRLDRGQGLRGVVREQRRHFE